MRGFPKNFCTKQDYLNVINDPEFAEQGKAALRRLADDRFIWAPTDETYTDDELTDEMREELNNGVDSRLVNTAKEDKLWTVFKKQEDPNAEIFRLGFTMEEVDELTA
ncbi:MAG: hypothetical protein IJ184_06545 [Alphaproteobacteria bacterium]|nr:hypothetical protein [Alphaproteobacteria bacterium]